MAHSMTIHDNLLIISNGYSHKFGLLCDMYCINLDEIISDSYPEWNSIGKPLVKCYGSIMVTFNTMILHFGGFGEGRDRNDLCIYNNIESIINNNKTPNISRLIDAYSQSNNFKLSIDILKLIQNYTGLISIKTSVNNISQRSFHNGCTFNFKNKQYLFIFGGTHKDTKLNDLYLLKF